jgi:catechol 2,3-dioxygenase-like lactoylglutathione lyase family enzyme
MQATIRYLAIVSDDPERLARFYTSAFGMRELGRSSTGDISVTDGGYNLSLLATRPELGPPGPRLFGIAVDDRAELEERLQRFAPGLTLDPDEGGLHYGEYCVTDPNGFAISVSTSGFGLNGGPNPLPAIRHVAMCEPQGDQVADFYLNVFGLEKASLGHWSATGRFLTDGTTSLALLADAEEMQAAGRKVSVDHYKQGLTHYGFETPRVGEFIEQLPAGTRSEQRLDRPDSRDYYRLWDPDGNHFDLRVAGAWGGGE